MAFQDFIQNPYTQFGAMLMAGADPNRQGLGGLGGALMGMGQQYRQQALLEQEQARNQQMADLQTRMLTARIAEQEQRAQAAQAQQANIEAAADRYPDYAEAIRAGGLPQVLSAITRQPETQRPFVVGDRLIAPSGEVLYQPAPGQVDQAQANEQWDLYQDVQKQEAPYREVANRANQIMAAINAPGGFSDTTLVSNIAKFLDPTSVVRPSETQALSEAGGLVASIQGMLTNAAGQGFITAPQRKEIRNMMERLTDIYQDEYKARRGETLGFFERRGIPSDVMGLEVGFPDFSAATAPVTPVQTQSGRTVNVRPYMGGP